MCAVAKARLNASTRMAGHLAETVPRACTNAIYPQRVWHIITASLLLDLLDRERVCLESEACLPPATANLSPPAPSCRVACNPIARSKLLSIVLYYIHFYFYFFTIIILLLSASNTSKSSVLPVSLSPPWWLSPLLAPWCFGLWPKTTATAVDAPRTGLGIDPCPPWPRSSLEVQWARCSLPNTQ